MYKVMSSFSVYFYLSGSTPKSITAGFLSIVIYWKKKIMTTDRTLLLKRLNFGKNVGPRNWTHDLWKRKRPSEGAR